MLAIAPQVRVVVEQHQVQRRPTAISTIPPLTAVLTLRIAIRPLPLARTVIEKERIGNNRGTVIIRIPEDRKGRTLDNNLSILRPCRPPSRPLPILLLHSPTFDLIPLQPHHCR